MDITSEEVSACATVSVGEVLYTYLGNASDNDKLPEQAQQVISVISDFIGPIELLQCVREVFLKELERQERMARMVETQERYTTQHIEEASTYREALKILTIEKKQ